ncbi:MAG TPA: DUF87 domain-containing protein [Candidatus Nitrosotalea sp.]|nr:DUF87 domain-containing protein [Candidatus Nitrosotalea sp.]
MKQRESIQYGYEVRPTNFFTLPPHKQSAVLARFFSLLASIRHPLRIIVSKEPLAVEMGSDTLQLQAVRTFMSSAEPLDSILESQGFSYAESAAPALEPSREFWRHVLLKDGRLAKCYTLCEPSSSLPAGWVHSLLSSCDMLSIEFLPVDQDRAVARLHRKAHLLKSTMSSSPKILRQTQMCLEAVSELEKNNTRLLAVTLNAIVLGRDMPTLRERGKKFAKACNVSLSRFDCTPAVQGRMASGWGKRLFLDLGSCDVFYPFASSDMLEVPGGIAIGVNHATGAPVIFDYAKRANYNILVLASSGAGKSVTAKLLLKRLLERNPGALAFVVDPEGEYERIAKYLGIEPLRVTGGEELGLDPFQMFEKPEDAAGVISEMSQAPPLVTNSFLAKCGGIKSISEFYSRLSDEEKKYLVGFVSGPISPLFRGEPRISERTIISLKGTYAEDYVAKVSFLALAKLWKKIDSAPQETPKILLIDEGHLIFRFASAARFVDLIARMGRKKNVIFIFVSQRVEDVTRTEAGRAFFDNSETKIILRNNEIASDELARSLQLSPKEGEMVSSFQPGEALILARDYRIRAYIMPSGEELDAFGTTPAGHGATPPTRESFTARVESM